MILSCMHNDRLSVCWMAEIDIKKIYAKEMYLEIRPGKGKKMSMTLLNAWEENVTANN